MAFSKVPYETYRKVFRISQKNIERELGAVQSASSDLSKRYKPGDDHTDSQEAIKTIDGMIGRIDNLKRKVCQATYSENVVMIERTYPYLPP